MQVFLGYLETRKACKLKNMKVELDEKEWKRLVSQGARLKSIRKSKGLSQSNLAENLGLSTTAIQNWERGANDILFKHRERLCYVLGCSFSEIAGEPAGDDSTISTLEKDIAQAVLNAPQTVQDVIQALILRYQANEEDGEEVAKAIKKLLGI